MTMTNKEMHDSLLKALKEVGFDDQQAADLIKLFFEKINTAIYESLISVFGPEADTKLKEGLKNAKTHEESDKLISDLCLEYKVDLETIKKRTAASAVPSAWKSLETKMTIDQWKKFTDVLEWSN